MKIAAKDKTLGLKRASKKKQQDAIDRTQKALKKMISNSEIINFVKVSSEAKVSRVWLYRQKDFRKKIHEEKLKSTLTEAFSKTRKKTNSQQIQKLKNRIKRLEKENAELKEQIEIVYGELYLKKSRPK